ncbi:MAG: nucleoside triphosphate pyrophosphohydrolase [Bacillota bacterium]|jgi:tetrapyrrole methylase family protein/MazG family protein
MTEKKVMIEVDEEFAPAAEETVRLLQVVKELRSDHGCPWDKEQTHESLKKYLIEESYEAVDAVDRQDDRDLYGELGDVLLQVAMHSKIAQEENRFDFAKVAKTVADKMVYRHPHVFGNRDDIETSDDVLKIWEILKSKENLDKTEKPQAKSVVDVPRVLPALMRAEKIQAKASRVGFDWDNVDGALAKLREEIDEVQNAETPKERKQEFGDVLFALVNVARFMDIDPEAALDMTNEKFIRRFKFVEESVKKSGREWRDFNLAELDAFWDMAKEQEKR